MVGREVGWQGCSRDQKIILAGFGKDQLSGNKDNDIFGFYAPGHFEVQDLNFAEDYIYSGVAQTGLSNIDEVNQMITAVNQREDGVEVEFGPDSSIDVMVLTLPKLLLKWLDLLNLHFRWTGFL